jgi:hypothetical protein
VPSAAVAVDAPLKELVLATSCAAAAPDSAATLLLMAAPSDAVAVDASTTAALSVVAVVAMLAVTLAVAADCAVCSPLIMRPSSPPAGGPPTTGYIAPLIELAAPASEAHDPLPDAVMLAVADPLGDATVSVRLPPACAPLG